VNVRLSKVSFYSLMLFLVALLVLVTTAPNPSWASPQTEVTSSYNRVMSEIDQIKQRKVLNVVMFFEDVPPFFMHNKQEKLVGIDVTLAQDIAKNLGVAVKFNRVPKTFDAVVDTVVKGESDVAISLLSNTLNRAVKVRFSDHYVAVRQTLLINRLQLAQQFPSAQSTEQIRSLLNQKEIAIGVIAGTSYVDFVNADYPVATTVLYDDFSSMVNDLQEGKIFALLYDELEIMNWRYNEPSGGLRFKTVLLNDRKDTIAFAVNRSDEDLLAWLNLYLNKIKEDGTLDTLLHQYLEQNNWRTQ